MSLSPGDHLLNEIADLRHTMRDLVALSALPAIWTGCELDHVAASLADAMRKTLALEVIYIRFNGMTGITKVIRSTHSDDTAERTDTLKRALARWLDDPFDPTTTISHPFREGTLHIASSRFGGGDDTGVMIAASSQPGFPTEQQRLLLSIGANQASIAIQQKRTEAERLRLLEREREARKEAQMLNEAARVLATELDLQRLVQKVTDIGTELTGAKFGAFFYNAVNELGESYVLYTLSGAPRHAFDKFGLPRNTLLFGRTFRGEGVVRIADVLQDPRYGKSAPHYGMPRGHLPVRSYLAAPVVSRSGTVLGGLFFAHPEVDVFTERSERLVISLAAQAAVGIDNAQLYGQAQKEIAERRRVEESERAARKQAERASRLRDEFLATVSHELRTPLGSILGWTELLRRAPQDENIRVQAREAIERAARAQKALIEDLLDMSRIITGKMRLEVQTVELMPLLQAVIETMRPAAEAKDIRIERVMDPFAGPLKGDPGRLQQVFWNLLSNAVKFTPKGGKIQVCLERINSHVEVIVSDTGQGIVPEFLPHVFDRFRQADSSTTRRYAGLGLGLAIVKHLVELHGGQVEAKSPGEGKGATFIVRLPIAIIQETIPGREHLLRHERGANEPWDDVKLTNIHVLVVDDDTDTCETLQRLLRECGASVNTAGSGQEALQRLNEGTYDIVVSDIGMPEMDGYEFIRRVRAQGVRIPAVAATAFARSEDRIRALQAGYNMHLSKPLESRELITVIAALVRTGLSPQRD